MYFPWPSFINKTKQMASIPSYRAFAHFLDNPTEHACAMFNVENIDLDRYKQHIDREDVVKRESWSHITLFYPLHNTHDLEPVKDSLFSPEVKLVSISSFELEDKDVLMLEVESEDLHMMHDMINGSIDHPEKSFPDYKPHITLCYVKKGASEKYTRRLEPEEQLTFKPVELLLTVHNEIGKRYIF